MAMNNMYRRTANGSQTRWFENLPGTREGATRLFCFPYAGGSANVFRSWQRYLTPEVSLSLAHLPGKGTRITEPSFTRLGSLISVLASEISGQLREPFAFWGHSMGALISFELARELRRRGQPSPFVLLISGRSAPHIPDNDLPAYNLPQEEFIAELRRLKGTPEELLTNPAMLDVFLPTIRADFELVETYQYKTEPPLACPIRVYGGLQDTTVPADHLKEWSNHTLAECRIRMFPGDHFFVHGCAGDVIHALRRDVSEVLQSVAHVRK
jgi:medium-chain acyl-[acyl-carrier-protein] hydrolase